MAQGMKQGTVREVFMAKRYFIGASLVIYSVFGVIACSKSTDTQNANGNVAAVPLTSNCPSGTAPIYTAGYQMCQGPGGVLTPPITQWSIGGGSRYKSDNFCMRNLSISNSTKIREFVKEAMGMCDQGQYSGGTSDCSAWANGYYQVELETNGSQAAVRISAMPTSTGYYYSIPSFSDFFLGMMGFPVYLSNPVSAPRNPLTLSLTLYPINNSQGFEGRSWGDPSTLAARSMVQVQVNTGKAGDPIFSYQIAYEGTYILSGNFLNTGANASYGYGYGGYYGGCY